MSTTLPEKEAPLKLRASPVLSMRRDPGQAAGTDAAAPLAPDAGSPAQPEAQEAGWLTVPALAACGAALLLGTGWLLQRRQRLRSQHQADAGPVEAPVAPVAPVAPEAPAAPVEPEAAVPEPAEQPAPAVEKKAGQAVDAMAEFAAQFEEQEAVQQPEQSLPAPLEHRHRAASRMGVARQKRLIKSLMWVRTVAGGAAILAAIAVVVFWAIESTDMGSGETGLTRPLLVLLLLGWAASWGAGQLANQLHRTFFGRVHPKFDT